MQLFYIFLGVIIGILINLLWVPYIFSEYYDMKKRDKVDKYKTTSKKEDISITRGVCNLIKNKEKLHTYNYNSDLYVNLKPSVNRMGGIQFTYSFWLRRSKTSGLNQKILFFRGAEIKDKNERGYVYENNPNATGTQKDDEIANDDFSQETSQSKENKNNRFIKCPLVRFVNDGLRVEFNTIKDPHMFVDLDGEIFGLLKSSKKNPKYNLITITFQDNFDFGGKERGIKVEVFIDDSLIKTSSFENNALRPNKGPIILFANDVDQDDNIDADFADLTYHNYAMDINDVDQLYKKGFADISCQLPDSWNDDQQRYSLGKINLYNETKQLF